MGSHLFTYLERMMSPFQYPSFAPLEWMVRWKKPMKISCFFSYLDLFVNEKQNCTNLWTTSNFHMKNSLANMDVHQQDVAVFPLNFLFYSFNQKAVLKHSHKLDQVWDNNCISLQHQLGLPLASGKLLGYYLKETTHLINCKYRLLYEKLNTFITTKSKK